MWPFGLDEQKKCSAASSPNRFYTRRYYKQPSNKKFHSKNWKIFKMKTGQKELMYSVSIRLWIWILWKWWWCESMEWQPTGKQNNWQKVDTIYIYFQYEMVPRWNMKCFYYVGLLLISLIELFQLISKFIHSFDEINRRHP